MEESPFQVSQTEAAGLTAAALAAADAVVLLNVATLNNNQAASLQNYVRDGGKLWLAPGNRVSADTFNRQFDELLPASLIAANVLPAQDYRLIADIDRRHPALSALDVDWGARFQGYWLTAEHEQGQVLMRFDSGDAMLSERAVGAGRVALLSTSLDLGWSNLPLQGLYVPFVHEMLKYLIQPAQRQLSWQIGDLIDLREHMAGQDSLQLREPDGTTLTVRADNPIYQARMPGFLTGPGELRLAVNIAPDAANLSRIDVASVSDRVLNPETTPPVSERVRTAQLIADIEQPQRLWWWILMLTAVLLLVETWIANRTYR
jgi:hypothetical protein